MFTLKALLSAIIAISCLAAAAFADAEPRSASATAVVSSSVEG